MAETKGNGHDPLPEVELLGQIHGELKGLRIGVTELLGDVILLRNELVEFKDETRAGLAELRGELAAFKTEVRTELTEIHHEITDMAADVREIRVDIHELRGEQLDLGERVKRLEEAVFKKAG